MVCPEMISPKVLISWQDHGCQRNWGHKPGITDSLDLYRLEGQDKMREVVVIDAIFTNVLLGTDLG